MNTRITTLDPPADIDAPVGTEEWTRGVLRRIYCKIQSLDVPIQIVQSWIRELESNQAWQALGYLDLESLVVSESKISADVLEALMTARSSQVVEDVISINGKTITPRKLNSHGGTRERQDNNCNLAPPKQGNSVDYLAARLERDHPEVYSRLQAGEFKSVRAAAVEAGIVKERSQIAVSGKDVTRAVAKMVTHFGEDDVRAVLDDPDTLRAAMEGRFGKRDTSTIKRRTLMTQLRAALTDHKVMQSGEGVLICQRSDNALLKHLPTAEESLAYAKEIGAVKDHVTKVE